MFKKDDLVWCPRFNFKKDFYWEFNVEGPYKVVNVSSHSLLLEDSTGLRQYVSIEFVFKQPLEIDLNNFM